MKKVKCITLLFVVLALILVIPSISNATGEITVSRDVYGVDGSMKFTFKGLTIDTTHEYEFGITAVAATAVEDWYMITETTATSVATDISVATSKILDVVNKTDTGYITIKDKTTNTVIVDKHAVNLRMPYLSVTGYEVLDNGKGFDTSNCISVPLRNKGNSLAYYRYEKIADEALIKKYKEIKANNGDYSTLESMIKKTAPTSGYSAWDYWNIYGLSGRNGEGYTTRTVNAPDEGLYYLWVYFSGKDIKPLYGCIIVDNLQPDIAVDSISLPATKTIELGETITLDLSFNPKGATNKIVTWSSSDETVATVDNAGKITPKKEGSAVITVISQDGNKKATCTVTVTKPSADTSTNKDNNKADTSAKPDTTTNKDTTTKTDSNAKPTTTTKTNDKTTASGKIPQTGLSVGLSLLIVVLACGVFAYCKYRRLKGI